MFDSKNRYYFSLISATENISDEVNRYGYLEMNIDMNFVELQWWQNHTSEYPRLPSFVNYINKAVA